MSHGWTNRLCQHFSSKKTLLVRSAHPASTHTRSECGYTGSAHTFYARPCGHTVCPLWIVVRRGGEHRDRWMGSWTHTRLSVEAFCLIWSAAALQTLSESLFCLSLALSPISVPPSIERPSLFILGKLLHKVYFIIGRGKSDTEIIYFLSGCVCWTERGGGGDKQMPPSHSPGFCVLAFPTTLDRFYLARVPSAGARSLFDACTNTVGETTVSKCFDAISQQCMKQKPL